MTDHKLQISNEDWNKYRAMIRLKADIIQEIYNQSEDLSLLEMIEVLEDVRMELDIEVRQIKERARIDEK